MIVSADPGKGGAVAFLSRDGETLFDAIDMPLAPSQANPDKTFVDETSLFLNIGQAVARAKLKPTSIVIEDVHSSPQMGSTSAFNFGRSYGALRGVLGGLRVSWGVPLHEVRPATWKTDLGLGSDKELALYVARATWPDRVDLFERKKDVDRAEAALLGLWFATR